MIENYFKIGGQTIDGTITLQPNADQLAERGLTQSQLEKTQGIQATQPTRKSKAERKSREVSMGQSNNQERDNINFQKATRKKNSQTELNLMKKTSMTSLNNEKSAE